MLDLHKIPTIDDTLIVGTLVVGTSTVAGMMFFWALLVMVLPAHAYPPNGHWSFSESSGATAKNSSSHHYYLTLNHMSQGNRVSGLANHRTDNALWFNGSNQDVSTNKKVSALQTPSITLSAWIKPVPPTDSTSPREWIAAQGDNYGLFITPEERSLTFYIKNASSEGWSAIKSSLNSINFNQWQSVAGTFNASSKLLSIYINGKLAGTKEIHQAIGYSTGDGFTVGSMQGERFFYGVIDEVKTYNKALSEPEVVQQNALLTTQSSDSRQVTKAENAQTLNRVSVASKPHAHKAKQAKPSPATTLKTEVWNGPPKLPDINAHPKAAYLKTFIDPVFGSRIKRVSDAKLFSKMDLGPGDAATKLRHHYASSAAWNSDSSKYLLNFGQVRDTQTNELVIVTSHYTYLKEYIWSKVNPNLIYGTSGNKLLTFNIATKKVTRLHTFTDFGNLSMDNLKILSDDDKLIVVSDVEAGGKKVAVYDIQNDKIISQINNIFDHPKISAGWHRVIPGISPSGKYIVMIDNGGGTHVFDQQLNYLRQLSLGRNHADIGYDSEGNEVLVQTCPARMIRLDDGQLTDLLGKTYGCGHVSMRNYRQHGWAIFSLSNNPEDKRYGKGQINEIVAVKLDKLGTTVRRLALPRSTYPYPSNHEMHSTMAVPNADGTKVIFNSAWGNPQGEINAYIIDVKLH